MKKSLTPEAVRDEFYLNHAKDEICRAVAKRAQRKKNSWEMMGASIALVILLTGLNMNAGYGPYLELQLYALSAVPALIGLGLRFFSGENVSTVQQVQEADLAQGFAAEAALRQEKYRKQLLAGLEKDSTPQ